LRFFESLHLTCVGELPALRFGNAWANKWQKTQLCFTRLQIAGLLRIVFNYKLSRKFIERV